MFFIVGKFQCTVLQINTSATCIKVQMYIQCLFLKNRKLSPASFQKSQKPLLGELEMPTCFVFVFLLTKAQLDNNCQYPEE